MKDKATRVMRLGWKHKRPGSGAFLNMTEKMGGGAHRMDIAKSCTLQELEDTLLSFFFEGGVNATAGISREDLTAYCVTNFSECRLPVKIDGVDFTVERYFQKVATTLIRVYILTEEAAEVRWPLIRLSV